MSTELAQRPQSVKEYLELPAYKARFGEVLGQRAPQFMASLVAIASQSNLARCEPRSVIASAMVAATLDLPIEKSLGFAHVVPYGDVAQFQMAAKGYVQLALRSGQYHRINAKPINKEAFGGYDEVGEPSIDWTQLDETKPTIGYVVAWKLVNGFTKIAYWPKEKVEAHAAKFSQAYKKKKMDSPWFTNFDKMAIKTVVMNELRAWGILSVQMQTALKHDMGAQKDVDSDVEYIDNNGVDIESSEVASDQSERPAPPVRAKKGAAAVQENAKTEPKNDATMEAEIVPQKAAATTQEAPPPAKEAVAAPTPDDEAKAHQIAADIAAEKKAEAAKKSAPATKTVRDSLEDKEEIVVACKLKKVFAYSITMAGTPTPSVQADVTGDFNGEVFDLGGGKIDKDEIVPSSPLWKVGETVKLTLRGRANKKTGKVMAIAMKIEATEGASESLTLAVE